MTHRGTGNGMMEVREVEEDQSPHHCSTLVLHLQHLTSGTGMTEMRSRMHHA
jgi:hypothetical protein